MSQNKTGKLRFCFEEIKLTVKTVKKEYGLDFSKSGLQENLHQLYKELGNPNFPEEGFDYFFRMGICEEFGGVTYIDGEALGIDIEKLELACVFDTPEHRGYYFDILCGIVTNVITGTDESWFNPINFSTDKRHNPVYSQHEIITMIHAACFMFDDCFLTKLEQSNRLNPQYLASEYGLPIQICNLLVANYKKIPCRQGCVC